MAKLCAKGKAAAKRKFKVYPSAYANMYASGVCSGKITTGGKKSSRTKKANGGAVSNYKAPCTMKAEAMNLKKGGFIAKGCGKVMNDRRKKTKTY